MSDIPENQNMNDNASAAGTAGAGRPWQWLRGLFGSRPGENSVRDAIEELIEEPATEAAAIDPDEGVLIANILKLHGLTAEDVMIPRSDIVAVDESAELLAVADLMSEAAHSRLPLYRGQLDEVVGFVHM